MALQAIVGCFVGLLLDGWSGTSPLWLLLLGGAGFVSGLLVTWRAFVAAQADEPTEPPGNSPDDTTRNQADSE
jgi:F0F1-type ATP synthase assembly protein I